MLLDSWKQGMRMGVGPGRITDGRKVNAGNYRIFETFFDGIFLTKVINGLIHSMWCMMYLG